MGQVYTKKDLLQGNHSMTLQQFRCVFKCRSIATKFKVLLGSSTATMPESYSKLFRGRSLFAISNNGRVAFDSDYSGTRVKAVFATSARHSTIGGLGVLYIQTIHGEMHLCWSYYTHVWSDETAEQFVTIFRDELGKMATLQGDFR